ncbi:MAG TPA: CDP-diacylglycerol--glycerol-3-phosphate 3-phosphatidyltransferase [Limnochordia bacterium]|nr:CDP-diacylglycerol--glycerol-3-phosphate 3-phosphatidyltransferase [Limnochordia bacterium]
MGTMPNDERRPTESPATAAPPAAFTSKGRTWSLPNLLTLSRIFLVPVFMSLVLEEVPRGATWAAVVFIIAAITDGLDGYMARLQRRTTRWGAFMDPVADKLLISAALVTLVHLGKVSAWLAMLIIGREFAVSGLRMVAAAEGVVIAASRLAKVKTTLQIIAVAGVLTNVPGAIWILWAAAAVTVISGFDYYLKAQVHLR